MTPEDAALLLEMVADLRRMVELAAFATFVAAGFVVGGVLHRWTRGH